MFGFLERGESKGLLEAMGVGTVTGALGGYTNVKFPAPEINSRDFTLDLVKFVAANYA